MVATRSDLMNFFSHADIRVQTVDHEPVFTVAESEKLHRDIAGAHTKNLFLKDKKGNLFLVVALHDATIDLKRISGVIGASGRVSFGKPELLWSVLGVQPGSVTPFSLINDREECIVKPIFDAHMMKEPILNYHPLLNNASTAITASDLLKFARLCGHAPEVLAVSDEAQSSMQAQEIMPDGI
ncbi:prolyl-tRNA synthetase associated domain-containing protein [Flexibacterium corallicola]|uniref:prolyl-tRNA synthetase associated domain-containing protein n=1 Tax=Flexibacterium corallicola TaxID=3037259 RepID=UPI00286F751B|nr:prolyl-tRNA synthetase associated domain-containing protein [Pseudovibrio sp. M1P-2-3]